YDFPTAWARFENNPANPLIITLRKEHFPYLVQSSKTLTIDGMTLYWKDGTGLNQNTLPPSPLNQISQSLHQIGSADVSITVPALPGSSPEVFLILTYHVDVT